MQIRPEVIDTALLRIFRNGFIHAGGRLSMASLEEDWKKLSIRRDDLYDALERLEAQGCLRTEVEPDGLYVVLTDKGAHRIGDLPQGVGELLRRSRDALELVAVDRRGRSPDGGELERRAGDKPGESASAS